MTTLNDYFTPTATKPQATPQQVASNLAKTQTTMRKLMRKVWQDQRQQIAHKTGISAHDLAAFQGGASLNGRPLARLVEYYHADHALGVDGSIVPTATALTEVDSYEDRIDALALLNPNHQTNTDEVIYV